MCFTLSKMNIVMKYFKSFEECMNLDFVTMLEYKVNKCL